VGMAPITRDTTPYEFDVIGVLSDDHTMRIEKTRCPALDGNSYHKPGADVAKVLMDWLSDGTSIDDAIKSATSAGLLLVTSRPLPELGDAVKVYLATLPSDIRETVKATLGSAYKERVAAEKSTNP
jgi:hypothetical protein